MNPNDPNNPNYQPAGFAQFYRPPNQQTNPTNTPYRPYLNYPFGFPDPNNPFQSFPQNFPDNQYGAYANFLGSNNPLPTFGSSPPETVPETQPEMEVGSSQRTQKSKKKGKASRTKEEPTRFRIPWNANENKCLVRAWMEHSEDEVIGKLFFYLTKYIVCLFILYTLFFESYKFIICYFLL